LDTKTHNYSSTIEINKAKISCHLHSRPYNTAVLTGWCLNRNFGRRNEMKRLNLFFKISMAASVCFLLICSGCTPQKHTDKITSQKHTDKVSPQKHTYKVSSLARRSINYAGAIASETPFENSYNENKNEVTFEKQILETDNSGSATAKITIKAVKYQSTHRNELIIDFDSAAEKNKKHPLAKLIDKSYTVKLKPTGEVDKVIDIEDIGVPKGGRPARAARGMFSIEEIKNRHGVLVIPDKTSKLGKRGYSWRSNKSFNFSLLGSSTFERIYKVYKIESDRGERIAVVKMNAIPTSKTTEDLGDEGPMGFLSELADIKQTYTGNLKIKLNTGDVEKYTEKLESEWIMVDPQAVEKNVKEPGTLTMKAVRKYTIERIK